MTAAPVLDGPAATVPDAPTLDRLVAAIAELAPGYDRTSAFPDRSFELLFEAGLLSLTVPTAAGGAGADLATTTAVLEEIGRGDPSVALVYSQHLLHHAIVALSPVWPDAVRDRLQRSTFEGVHLVNALRVEPELGTPARGGLPATVAHRQPDGSFRLVGHKIYATGIPHLRWLVTFARTDDPEPLVGNFVVDARTDGWRIVEAWDHLGMRATASHDVVFEGARVDPDAVVDLRPVAQLAPPDPLLMAWNSLTITALYHGVARSARDWLVGYLHERVPSGLGKPLATLPRFQEAVGRIEARLSTSSRLLRGVTADVDAGVPGALAESALVKHTVTTNAIDAVMEAIALVGNPGLSRSNPLERHLRDVLCSRIHTPQDDMILAGAGRSALAAAAPQEAR